MGVLDVKLVNFSKRLGLEKDVLFLGNRTDLVKLWNCIDVGVLCSLSECHSISLVEGMACEVPFVATKVGGNPEVIENPVQGGAPVYGRPGVRLREDI